MMRVAAFLFVFGLVAVQGAASVHAQPSVDFEVASDDDRARLAQIKKLVAANDEQAVYELDALFARLARPSPLGDSRNAPGDALVELPEEGQVTLRFRPLRALVLDLATKLPPELFSKLAKAQGDAAATEKKRSNVDGLSDEGDHFLRRYPLAPETIEVARRLAESAFESGDSLGALALDRFVATMAALHKISEDEVAVAARHARRAHALLDAGDEETAQALAAEIDAIVSRTRPLPVLVQGLRGHRERAAARREARESRRPPDGRVPELLASYKFIRTDPRRLEAALALSVPPTAAHRGDVVFASDGARILAVSARSGELKARLPQDDDDVPPPSTGLPGTVTAHDDMFVAPLFFENFLLPARANAELKRSHEEGEGEGSIRAGWFSLFAFDARQLKLVWCDGEGAAPRGIEDGGRPAGMSGLDAKTWQRLARLHVVGRPLLDGRRVYVPLSSATNEAQVWVAAYDRVDDRQGLALVPAWWTYLGVTALNQPANQPQNTAIPTVNPRLTLDPEGRVLVQSELGFVASLDARTGSLGWVVRFADDERGRRGTQSRSMYMPSNDAPVVVPGDGVRPSIAVVASPEESRWVGVSCLDGTVLWRSARWRDISTGALLGSTGNEVPRVVAIAPDVVLGYGGRGFVAFDGITGSSLVDPQVAGANRTLLSPQERPVGEAVRAGSGQLLLPISGGGEVMVRTLRYQIRRSTTRDSRVPLSVDVVLGGESYGLGSLEPRPEQRPLIEGPSSLMVLEDRLVVTTGRRIAVYTWGTRE